MPDTPGSPTPEEVMAEKMAELDKMKADMTAERQALATDRANTNELNSTISNLTTALQDANRPAPEPEPDLGEYDEATLRAAAQLTKKQLEAYHSEIAPRLERNDAAQFENEWARERTADPKNFDRMEQTMRKHFDANPGLKQPGAVATLFVQMKGTHYNKLQEMDRADRQLEIENPTPAPTNDPVKKSAGAGDSLSDEEWKFIRGLGRDGEGNPNVDPEHYFLSKHGRYPDFDDNYIEDRGYEKVTRGM